MADKKYDDIKKKPVTKDEANRVADFLKQQANGGPALPTPKDNPVTTDDDNDDQGN